MRAPIPVVCGGEKATDKNVQHLMAWDDMTRLLCGRLWPGNEIVPRTGRGIVYCAECEEEGGDAAQLVR